MKKQNVSFQILATALLILLTPALTLGNEPPVEPAEAGVDEKAPSTPEKSIVDDTAQAPLLSAQMRDIQEALQLQNISLAELAEQFRTSTNEDDALAIQKQIQQVKMDTELQILKLQLLHAKRDNRSPEIIENLEQAILLVTEPRPILPPQPREDPNNPTGK
jgi:hypothetical protein